MDTGKIAEFWADGDYDGDEDGFEWATGYFVTSINGEFDVWYGDNRGNGDHVASVASKVEAVALIEARLKGEA